MLRSFARPIGTLALAATVVACLAVAPPSAGTGPHAEAPQPPYRGPDSQFFDERTPFRGPNGTWAGHPTEVAVGILAPTEGDTYEAELGRSLANGALLAVDLANEAGGIRGVASETAIRAIVRSDADPWSGASRETAAFSYGDGVCGIVGGIDGASTHVALRVVLKSQVPFVVCGCTDSTVSQTRIPWLVRCIADDYQSAYALGQHIFKVRGLRRVCGIRTTTRYGRMGMAKMHQIAMRMGHQLQFDVRVRPGETIFTRQIDRVRGAPIDGIILWGEPREMGRVAGALRAEGITVPLFGTERLVEPEFVATAGDAAEGIVCTHPCDPTTDRPALAAFHAEYEDRCGAPPDVVAAHAFDGMNILLQAMREVGFSRVDIQNHLNAMTEFEGVTGHIVFDSTLTDVGRISMAQLRDGQWHFFPAPPAPREGNRRP